MAATKFPAPPIISHLIEPQHPLAPVIPVTRPWVSWFQSVTNALNSNPVPVTGSRASGAALQSLLTQLAAAGIITDNTTA